MRRANGGFTLIELVASLAAAALVLMVAASLLLLGVRVENRARDNISEQQTVSVMFGVTGELAAGGDIRTLAREGESWTLYDKEGDLLLEYNSEGGSLGMGGVLLENVENAGIRVEDKCLALTIETERGSYETTVYCRVGNINEITP